jgi:hypothetical protein
VKSTTRNFGDLEPLLDLLIATLLRDIEAEQSAARRQVEQKTEGDSK